MKKIILSITALLILSLGVDARAKKTSKKVKKKPTYYYNNTDGTMSRGKADEHRASPYKGDKVPENDGVKKNKQRNLNYNTGQALPSNSGK